MQGECYRVGTPTLAILSLPNGKRIPRTVPKGAIVTVLNGPLDGTRLVDVEWDGQMVMMFTVDLRERGTLIKQGSPHDTP
jgi:hypothetical protein